MFFTLFCRDSKLGMKSALLKSGIPSGSWLRTSDDDEDIVFLGGGRGVGIRLFFTQVNTDGGSCGRNLS